MRLCFNYFFLTHLSLRAKSNKTDAKEVSYKASNKASLTRKTRLKSRPSSFLSLYDCMTVSDGASLTKRRNDLSAA